MWNVQKHTLVTKIPIVWFLKLNDYVYHCILKMYFDQMVNYSLAIFEYNLVETIELK